MATEIRSTRQTRALMGALAGAPQAWRYGYDLSRETGLKSGTLYPLMMRLAERGWLESRWEEAGIEGRPPRRLCRLTAEGQVQAAKWLADEAPAAAARWSPAT